MGLLDKQAKGAFKNQRSKLLHALEALGRRVLSREDLRQIRRQVVPGVAENQLRDYLLQEGIMEEIVLESPQYNDFRRLVLKGATAFEVALSLRSNSYLSHASAVFLHGLTEQLPLRIYVNREQTAKPEPEGSLTQVALDRAFARPSRETNYIFKGPSYDVVLLNGKFTANLEVGQIKGPEGELLNVTKLERTLIDITVRPNYAGGVYQVLEAYRAAKPRASIGVLLATLRKLNYMYPYHQAIGLYMERAGYPENSLERVAELGAELDFYLTHGLSARSYSDRWRLFIPEGF